MEQEAGSQVEAQSLWEGSTSGLRKSQQPDGVAVIPFGGVHGDSTLQGVDAVSALR